MWPILVVIEISTYFCEGYLESNLIYFVQLMEEDMFRRMRKQMFVMKSIVVRQLVKDSASQFQNSHAANSHKFHTMLSSRLSQ
jgi:hypothetical protein